jgi:hypothetical protein
MIYHTILEQVFTKTLDSRQKNARKGLTVSRLHQTNAEEIGAIV